MPVCTHIRTHQNLCILRLVFRIITSRSGWASRAEAPEHQWETPCSVVSIVLPRLINLPQWGVSAWEIKNRPLERLPHGDVDHLYSYFLAQNKSHGSPKGREAQSFLGSRKWKARHVGGTIITTISCVTWSFLVSLHLSFLIFRMEIIIETPTNCEEQMHTCRSKSSVQRRTRNMCPMNIGFMVVKVNQFLSLEVTWFSFSLSLNQHKATSLPGICVSSVLSN